MSFKSDIEIAQETTMQPITEVAKTAGIAEPEALGTIITKNQRGIGVHKGQLARLKNDPDIPPLLYPPIPQSNQIAGSVEGDYRTLKSKYSRANYDDLFDLAEAFRQRIEEGE